METGEVPGAEPAVDPAIAGALVDPVDHVVAVVVVVIVVEWAHAGERDAAGGAVVVDSSSTYL